MRIGLSISDDALRLVKLGQDRLIACHEVFLPPHTFNHGVVNDPETLTEALRSLKEKFGLKAVNATFTNKRGHIFTTTLFKDKNISLEEMVSNSVEENVHMPKDKVHFDFHVIEETDEWAEVAVAVSPKPLISSYRKIFKKAGITPEFHPEPQTLARSVLPQGESRPHIIVSVGDHADIYIVERGVTHSASISSLENLKKELDKMKIFWNTSLDKYGSPRHKLEKVYVIGVKTHLIPGNLELELADVWKNLPYKPVAEVSFIHSLAYAPAIGAALSSRSAPWWKF